MRGGLKWQGMETNFDENCCNTLILLMQRPTHKSGYYAVSVSVFIK